MQEGTGVGVVGLGNVLMGDDAVGPHVVRLLEAGYRPASGLMFVDGGTPGLELVTLLSGLRAAVLVDAVLEDELPGTVRVYSAEEVKRGGPALVAGPHDPGLREALLALESLGAGPSWLRLVGVAVAGRPVTGPGLSAVVRRALPRAEREVLGLLCELGIRLPARVPPAAPDIWWEAR